MNTLSTLCLCAIAGSAVSVASANEPETWPAQTMKTQLVNHTYYNPSTGEKVVTILDGSVRPASSASGNPEVWISDDSLPCASVGQTQGTSAIIDNPALGTSLATGVSLLDWGDIPSDTLVDCIGISYATQHLDTDTDGDTVGEGVAGFAATWSFFDADNGFNSCFTRTGLIALTLFNLQGPLSLPGPGVIATFSGTVDLGGTSPITFEIGDSDSDLNGASVHNANIFNTDVDGDTVVDSDFDGDGLYDFAYSIGFNQPGTADFDGDTIPDGDPAAAALAGTGTGTPTGSISFDTATGVTSFTGDALPQAQGVEDAWDAYDSSGQYVGSFNLGGFSCYGDTDGDTVPDLAGAGQATMFAQVEARLFGGDAGPCAADLFPVGAPDGILNFLDLGQYLSLFGAMDPAADLFPVGAPDGNFNFLDLGEYLNQFGLGCP